MDNHPLSGRSVGAGHAPPAAIRGRSFAGKVPGRACPAPTESKKAGRGLSPLPAYSISYCPFFCFRVSARCRTAKTGWWNSIRGPLQRMTWRMRSRISGL